VILVYQFCTNSLIIIDIRAYNCKSTSFRLVRGGNRSWIGVGEFLSLSAEWRPQRDRRIKAAVALSDRYSDDIGRVGRRGAWDDGVVSGWLEGAGEEGRERGGDAKHLSPTVAVATYSGAVFLSVDAFELAERGSPVPLAGRDEDAVIAMVSMIAGAAVAVSCGNHG
jgi:hypothetical protein